MTLQEDWLAYVKNPQDFADDHFGPLITDTDEPVDLQVAFGSLPNGSELIRRIERVRHETLFTGLYHIPDPARRITRPEMQSLSERYAHSVAQRLESMGERNQAEIVWYKPMVFVAAADFKLKSIGRKIPFINASMDIQFDFIDYVGDQLSFYYGLNEAVLFMTKCPPITRYLLSSIVDYPVDDEAYYELWRGGGDIEFCEDRTLIILPDDYEELNVV